MRFLPRQVLSILHTVELRRLCAIISVGPSMPPSCLAPPDPPNPLCTNAGQLPQPGTGHHDPMNLPNFFAPAKCRTATAAWSETMKWSC